MLGFAWLTIRQAQEALKNGRLEEAHCLLGQPVAQGHQRTWELTRRLARAFVERGVRHLRQDDPDAAWADLLRAEQINSADAAAERLRVALVRLGLAEVRSALQGNEPSRAVETVALLQERGGRHPDLKWLDEAANSWLLGRELVFRGEFTHALEVLNRVGQLLPENTPLRNLRGEVAQHQQRFPALLVRLHEAVERQRWREVVELAEEVLRTAPQYKEARRARDLAWKAVQPATVATPAGSSPVAAVVAADEPARRFLLWIDGVGGYLICLGQRVTFGQAMLDTFVDVPLFADVSRLHATVTRDAEGYFLEAVRTVQVNGRPAERTILRSNDRLTLGASCQFRFHLPSPLSTTARLELVSGHRLPLAVDSVLLMADTLLLGEGPQAHVQVPGLKEPVVLFRHRDGLGVRHSGSLVVNGERCEGRGLLSAAATVTGADFSFALEPVGTRLGRG
jgi:tetratricopeptide (TPR) repeat protein